MGDLPRNRKLRLAQSAVVGLHQVLRDMDDRHTPVLDHVDQEMRMLRTNVVDMFALGLARFIGVDLEQLQNPVTSGNWRGRLGAAKSWVKMTDKECEDGEFLYHRSVLTPEEFARVRLLVEKLEALQRQGVLQLGSALDPMVLDDEVAF